MKKKGFTLIELLAVIVVLAIIAIIATPMVLNTAIEAVVDMITTKEDPKAKVAKDAAAGAVLITSVIAAFIGVIIFLPKIFEFLISL